MTDEKRGEGPANNPETQPAPQGPMPVSPQQGEMGKPSNGDSAAKQGVASELAREFKWVEFAQIGSNVVLAIVGIIALCIYHAQLTTMQRQLTQIQNSSAQAKLDNAAAITAQKEIAQSSLTKSQKNFEDSQNSSRDQLRLDQRAWVGVVLVSMDSIEADKPICGHAVFANSGKTFAKHVYPSVHMHFDDALRKKPPPLGQGESPEESIGVIPPTTNSSFGSHVCTKSRAKKDDLTTIKSKYIYIWGEVAYKDIFKQPHMTIFCSYRYGDVGDFIQCPFHNDAD